MKSNVCIIKKGGLGIENILSEVEKVTSYNDLPHKEALRLRLLAEELAGMLPGLMENFEGVFWAENEGTDYSLHVQIAVEELSMEKKRSIIEVSAKKKNAAAIGFMGKIRDVAENMLLNSDDIGLGYAPHEYMYNGGVDATYTYAWTLERYNAQYSASESKGEAADQLERSIVAKLADDVIVGVRGKKVDVIIKKKF